MGIKGSPKMTQERPIDFFVPMIQCNTNTLEACRINEVKKVLYTSSIAVLNPQTDKFPAFAKTAAEMQIEAYKIQYPKFGQNCFIVRPSNVYGRFDNFDNLNAMVVTSLVRKAILNNVIEVWGDGSETREFISARDVARGMILTMEKSPDKPVNLGSGEIHSIQEVAEILSELSDKPITYLLRESKGDKNRVVYNDLNQADIGFKAEDSFKESIVEIYNSAKNYYLNR
jgi:nucleoside-diphosphate-sugar epimerase